MGFAQIWRPIQELLSTIFESPGDTPLEATRKMTFGPLLVSVLVVSTIFLFITWEIHDTGFMLTGLVFFCLIAALVLLVWMKRGPVKGSFVATSSALMFLAIWVADFIGSLGMFTRVWPASVILLDALLVSQANERIGYTVLALLSIWLLVDSFEHSYRAGLYSNEVLLFKYEDRGNCSCDEPPCAIGVAWGFINLVIYYIVMYLDYYFTRRFATTMFRQQEEMENTAKLANNVAGHLAAFDLQQASEVLMEAKDAGSLPLDMIVAFDSIVEHLSAYRPFLPEALFPNAPRSSRDPSINMQYCDETRSESIVSHSQSRRFIDIRSEPCDNSTIDSAGKITVNPMKIGLSVKRISVAMLNFRGFNKQVHEMFDSRDVAQHMSELLSNITSSIGLGRVDRFNGDRVMISWNASAVCRHHVECACEGATTLRKSLIFGGIPLGIGVASGDAFVGNVGSDVIRSFNIIGYVVTGAAYLCNVASFHAEQIPVILAWNCRASDCHNRTNTVGFVTFQATPCPVVEITEEERPREEWMYELAASENEWELATRAFMDDPVVKNTSVLRDAAPEARSWTYLSKVVAALHGPDDTFLAMFRLSEF